MASVKQAPSGKFQLCIKNKLLPKTLWLTFDERDVAEQYGAQLDGLLAQGIVPVSLLERSKSTREIWTIPRCIAEYLRNNSVPLSDIKLLDTIRPTVSAIGTANLNYDWAEAWICSLKRTENLSPSTIRHRHGALARCFDWMVRKHPELMAQNPLRLIKRGFATYTEADIAVLAKSGKEPRETVERDRRLEEGEEQLIVDALTCDPLDQLFFTLALETAMRMRECYTLLSSQVSLPKRTIHLERSKNGDNRQVPLSSTAVKALQHHLVHEKDNIRLRDGRLFGYWNGERDDAVLDATTANVSRIFRLAFARAGIDGLTFHDLRHEATCRLYERTALSDVLIAKITGHRDLRMLKRYASLRGSDLAVHLW